MDFYVERYKKKTKIGRDTKRGGVIVAFRWFLGIYFIKVKV